MKCKDCGQEVNKATVNIDDIIADPNITLSADYWIKKIHRKECVK